MFDGDGIRKSCRLNKCYGSYVYNEDHMKIIKSDGPVASMKESVRYTGNHESQDTLGHSADNGRTGIEGDLAFFSEKNVMKMQGRYKESTKSLKSTEVTNVRVSGKRRLLETRGINPGEADNKTGESRKRMAVKNVIGETVAIENDTIEVYSGEFEVTSNVRDFENFCCNFAKQDETAGV